MLYQFSTVPSLSYGLTAFLITILISSIPIYRYRKSLISKNRRVFDVVVVSVILIAGYWVILPNQFEVLVVDQNQNVHLKMNRLLKSHIVIEASQIKRFGYGVVGRGSRCD